MPVLSAIIFVALPRAGSGNGQRWDCSMPVITGWLQVRVLPATHANRDFPWFDEYPRFCGAQSRLAVSAGKKDRFRGSSGPSVSGNPKTVSPERGKEESETRFASISPSRKWTQKPESRPRG